jgi:protein-L-isoaspartate O-methyltransferase
MVVEVSDGARALAEQLSVHVADERVSAAMRQVPRDRFVPAALRPHG